jgi:hypothetical protein
MFFKIINVLCGLIAALKIHVSESAYELLVDRGFLFELRGSIDVKVSLHHHSQFSSFAQDRGSPVIRDYHI